MRVYAHMSGLFKASREFSPGFSGIKLYAAGLALISTTLVVGLAISDGLNDGPGSAWPLLGFALLALVAEGQTVRLTDNLQLSVAFLPLLFVAVVFGPLPAALIGAATVLIDFAARSLGGSSGLPTEL